MFMTTKKLSKMSTVLVFAATCFSAAASASVFISVGIPAPQAVYVAPSGFANCYMVPSGIYNGIWLNSHRVCRNANGALWFGGRWQCYSRNIFNGRCNDWQWMPAYTIYPGAVGYNYWWGWGMNRGWWGPGYHHHHHGWGPGPGPMPGPMGPGHGPGPGFGGHGPAGPMGPGGHGPGPHGGFGGFHH